ncbi:MAG: transglycosylase SLT domain-containing protein [Pseudomonadota bacterium]
MKILLRLLALFIAVGPASAQQVSLPDYRPEARPPHMLRYPVEVATRQPTLRPVARDRYLPRARWDFKDGGHLWTRAAMSAIATHADVLTDIVPRDIDTWCPGYATATETARRAFWVGMMSALSKHESTYNPRAVGGGDLWYGLLQIYPDTARRYACRARSGEALKSAADNLSCAARIMAVTVARDNAVAVHDGRWRGVAADWGPMTNRSKINEMAAWTRTQSYCAPLNALRPVARPNLPAAVSTMTVTLQPD